MDSIDFQIAVNVKDRHIVQCSIIRNIRDVYIMLRSDCAANNLQQVPVSHV